MARIKTNIHQRIINFCGKCGVILGSDIELLDKCKKCGEIIEPWLIVIVEFAVEN